MCGLGLGYFSKREGVGESDEGRPSMLDSEDSARVAQLNQEESDVLMWSAMKHGTGAISNVCNRTN